MLHSYPCVCRCRRGSCDNEEEDSSSSGEESDGGEEEGDQKAKEGEKRVEGEGDKGRKVEAVALVDEGEIEGFTDLAVGFWICIIYTIYI